MRDAMKNKHLACLFQQLLNVAALPLPVKVEHELFRVHQILAQQESKTHGTGDRRLVPATPDSAVKNYLVNFGSILANIPPLFDLYS